MNHTNEMPTIRFSEIVDGFANMNSLHGMKGFREVLMGYIREKYLSERNDKIRLKCFTIDYYEQIIKSPSYGDNEEQTKIKNTGRSIRRWLPSPTSRAKKDKLDYVQRETVIKVAFTLTANSAHETAKKIEDNGRIVTKKLLYAMGCPDLSASSEAEIFVIFALENGLDYRTCQEYYKEYLKFTEENHVEPDLKEIGTTTHFYNYFGFSSLALDRDHLFEKVAAKAHEFRVGSKRISDQFAEEFSRKAKDTSVLDTAALFFLMFSTGVTTEEKVEIFSDALTKYKIYIEEDGAISNHDELSQWLRKNKCHHVIIAGKKSGTNPAEASDHGCLFDTFYSELEKCRSKKYATYISREGFIMWLLFCEKEFDEINAIIGGRFPTLNLNSCFDRYATIIADFSYKKGRIHYFDRIKQIEYIVEDDQVYDWITPPDGNLSQLRASIADVLSYAFPAECRIPSLVATGRYVVTPKVFQNSDTEIG